MNDSNVHAIHRLRKVIRFRQMEYNVVMEKLAYTTKIIRLTIGHVWWLHQSD